mgnify:CR=1 FL=1
MPFQESTTTVNATAVALGSNGFAGRARMIVQNGGGGGVVYVGSGDGHLYAWDAATGITSGTHARSAFGVAQIPLGACVEIELIAEVA